MELYCPQCRCRLPSGCSSCPSCGGVCLACCGCNRFLPEGTVACPTCAATELVAVEPPTGAARAVAAIPAAARSQQVAERYRAGRYGVEAEVTRPAGDVAILNELGKLVELLHAMAARANQFVGQSEHTVKMRRDMRVLATDIQEEIELRTGPRG